MTRILFSGAVLAADLVVQLTRLVSHSESVGLALLAGVLVGLLPSVHHFTEAAFAVLTEHGETFNA
jgi:hypothetical protein